MHTTWVITADRNRARIFEMSDDQHLHEIEDMINPDGRMQDRDEISDAHGRFAQGKGGHTRDTNDVGSAGLGHRMPSNTEDRQESMREHQAVLFTKEVGRYLDKARNEHRFEKLCVIADPKMLGLMRNNISKEVQSMVEEEIPKEITSLKSHEVEQFLKQRPH